jgi:hypothetical protein
VSSELKAFLCNVLVPLTQDSVRAAIGAAQGAVAAVPSTRAQAGGRSRQRRQQPAQQEPSSARRRPHKQASAPPNGTFISVDLSSGSEGDAQPQVCAVSLQHTSAMVVNG